MTSFLDRVQPSCHYGGLLNIAHYERSHLIPDRQSRSISTSRHNLTLVTSTFCKIARMPDISGPIIWQDGAVTRGRKEQILGQRGCIIWFTGLSGSGKSTVALALEHKLAEKGYLTTLLDGDNIRHGLCKDLGFCCQDREENIRRIGEVAKLMAQTGIITLTSFISPYASHRNKVRESSDDGDFIEVHMDVPLEVCENRDVKGLYNLARSGKIQKFTGISDPYEAPTNPEIRLQCKDANGNCSTPGDLADVIWSYLERKKYIK